MNNSQIFGQGIARAKAQILKQMQKAYKEIATNLLADAVQLWEGNTSIGEEFSDGSSIRDGVNMTGNTINSYMAGCYYKGSLVDIIYAYDVGVTDKPTADYSYPGDQIYTWHQAYFAVDPSGSKYNVPNGGLNYIQNYKSKKFQFQQVGRGNGIDDAKKLLQDIHPEGIIGLAVVVGVPYADYLESTRKLDVLRENAKDGNVKAQADMSFDKIKL